MLIEDFRRILTAFADTPADLDLERGTLLVQIHDDVIEAKVTQRGGDLFVEEAGQRAPAAAWLIQRVARIPLLADRILSYVQPVESFVMPSGHVLDQPDFARGEEETACADAAACATGIMGRQLGGTTSVLYLTSDAGEGKTTLIKHVALQQAQLYKEKRTDWLLVPIPLGGRSFLRFDDVVVAALVNRLRFQLFYYEAFLELVRLGVLVPAFDGFEEMIIETSSGEAISALGTLVRNLRSSGSVLIAARKAYFDYQSFRTQAQLFDAVGTDSVAFARLSLDRWSRDHFLSYALKRKVAHPVATYDAVAERLRRDHPLLTRAVLVRRLVDVALQSADLRALLDAIGSAPHDYFYQFVSAIVEREAQEKWLDRSGDPPTPLLTTEEHHELLSMVAQELWYASADSLRPDVVGVVAEMFADARHKPPTIARQVKERLKQHSLLVSTTPGGSLAFDHEDFRSFYLGEGVGHALLAGDQGVVRAMLQVASLPAGCVEHVVLNILRHRAALRPILELLQKLATPELPTSFVRENCGVLAIALVDRGEVGQVRLANMNLPPESLRGKSLENVEFEDCYFQPTSLHGSRLAGCVFRRCRFERLEVSEGQDLRAVMEECELGSVVLADRDEQLFDPAHVAAALGHYGIAIARPKKQVPVADVQEPDEGIRLVERALRAFLRATQVNESLIRMKLGVKANVFFSNVLPDLERVGVLERIPYHGAGVERRFKLGVQMHRIQEALSASGGKYDRFLAAF